MRRVSSVHTGARSQPDACVHTSRLPVYCSQTSSARRPPNARNSSPTEMSFAGRASRNPPWTPRTDVTSPARRSSERICATYSVDSSSRSAICRAERLGAASGAAPSRASCRRQRRPYSSSAEIFMESPDAERVLRLVARVDDGIPRRVPDELHVGLRDAGDARDGVVHGREDLRTDGTSRAGQRHADYHLLAVGGDVDAVHEAEVHDREVDLRILDRLERLQDVL